jgi:Flp pilus assembly protein CpaB
MPLTIGATLPSRLVRVRRAVLARRRGLALLCAAAAVLTGLHAVQPPPAPATAVLTAARDLPAGTVVSRADLETRRFATGTVPDGVLGAESVGRTLAAGVRRGEPITDARLVGPALSSGEALAVPVRLPDAGMVDLLSVGDRIDLVATSPRSGAASVLAYDVPVLALPPHEGTGPSAVSGGGQGALVVLGVEPGQVSLVAGAATSRVLTYAFSR